MTPSALPTSLSSPANSANIFAFRGVGQYPFNFHYNPNPPPPAPPQNNPQHQPLLNRYHGRRLGKLSSHSLVYPSAAEWYYRRGYPLPSATPQPQRIQAIVPGSEGDGQASNDVLEKEYSRSLQRWVFL